MSGSSAASRLAASGGVLALATALLTVASPAGASPEPAFWVSAGGASAGASPGCRTAQYTTVQSAVTAAEAYGYQGGVASADAPLGATSSLPSGTPPAFVRPIDTVSGPAIDPLVYGNSFDGSAYHPA